VMFGTLLAATGNLMSGSASQHAWATSN